MMKSFLSFIAHEELKTKKLNLPQNLNKIVDFNSNDCKEFQNSNEEQPLNLSIKKERSTDVETQENRQTSLDQMKIEKSEYEGKSCL